MLADANIFKCLYSLEFVFRWTKVSYFKPSFFLFSLIQVEYLKSKALGGAVVWTLDMDDFSGRFCEMGRYPLITHLKALLFNGKAHSLYKVQRVIYTYRTTYMCHTVSDVVIQ